MNILRKFYSSSLMITTLVLAWSPAAFAGGPGAIIRFGPVSATPVPTLGSTAMVALGLLLAVIALRMIKGGATGKTLAIALFSTGLAVGGLGVERTLATSSFTVDAAGDCEAGGSQNVAIRSQNEFTNGCPNLMQINSYQVTEESCIFGAEQLINRSLLRNSATGRTRKVLCAGCVPTRRILVTSAVRVTVCTNCYAGG